jgi:hypothetical protein
MIDAERRRIPQALKPPHAVHFEAVSAILSSNLLLLKATSRLPLGARHDRTEFAEILREQQLSDSRRCVVWYTPSPLRLDSHDKYVRRSFHFSTTSSYLPPIFLGNASQV